MAERLYAPRPRPESAASAPVASSAPDRVAVVRGIVRKSLDTQSRPLDAGTREYMEQRFGHDFSRIRVHTDESASEAARAVGAPAYTVGRDIIFGARRYAPGTEGGRRLLAHELAHVVQQAGAGALHRGDAVASVSAPEAEFAAVAAAQAVHAGVPVGPLSVRTGSQPVLQRYEAGEHAQFGEAGDALKDLVGSKAFGYKVKPGETPRTIAARFGVTEQDVLTANRSMLKEWKPSSGVGGMVRGFNAGDMIVIPPAMNDAVREALKSKELHFVLNGVTFDYGDGIAMGDLFRDPEHMLAATDATLRKLQELIKKDKVKPGSVTPGEWNEVTGTETGGKYTELAEENESHFAPANPALAPVSGKSVTDNKSSWEKYHAIAITEAQAGNKDRALAVNAFADHFLTDAFAAGHLVNKRDVMELFTGKLPFQPRSSGVEPKFAPASVEFFNAVSRRAFVGPVAAEFSRYETVKSYTVFHVHPSINSWSRFSEFLQGIAVAKPDVLPGAVTKSVHDTLNREPDGVPVANNMGDHWNLSGDKSLNEENRRIGRKAVAQSELNVLSAFKLTGPIDLPAAYKKVWDYVPHATSVGEEIVKRETASGTDPKSASLINDVAGMIGEVYPAIIEGAVKEGYLRLSH